MRRVVVQYSDEERLAFIKKHEVEWRTVGTLIFNIRTELRISQERLAKEARQRSRHLCQHSPQIRERAIHQAFQISFKVLHQFVDSDSLRRFYQDNPRRERAGITCPFPN